tara:strand:+ start:499 stop:774 length:276 start_codon:yes stop_codon:yes gene_type:complete
VSVRQPRTLEERVEVCKSMLEVYGLTEAGFETAVDDPSEGNLFSETYKPWPIRMYVVEGSRITFISEPEACAHDVGKLRDFLEQRHGGGVI